MLNLKALKKVFLMSTLVSFQVVHAEKKEKPVPLSLHQSGTA